MNAGPLQQDIRQIAAWLDAMQVIYPPRGALLVGAGNGTGPLVQWLVKQGLPQVSLVEADPQTCKYLARHVPAELNWQLKPEVVTPLEGAPAFHETSNPAESGLLPALALHKLWPSLQASSEQTLEHVCPITLLQAEAGQPCSWLMIDCLPAGALLNGVPLAGYDLVLARVVQDGMVANEYQAHTSGVEAILTAQGFRMVAQFKERQGQVALAAFVRAPHSAQPMHLAAGLSTSEAFSKQNPQLGEPHFDEQAFHTVLRAKAEVERAKKQAQSEVAEHLSLVFELKKEFQTRAQALQDQASEVLEAQRHAFTQERNELIQAKMHAQAQLAELTKELTTLETKVQVLQEEAHAAYEAQHQIALQEQNARTQARQAQAAIDQAEKVIHCLKQDNANLTLEKEAAQLAFFSETQAKQDALAQVHELQKEVAVLLETLSRQNPGQEPTTTDVKDTQNAEFSRTEAPAGSVPSGVGTDLAEAFQAQLKDQQVSIQNILDQLVKLEGGETLHTLLDVQHHKQLTVQKDALKELETRIRNEMHKGFANTVKQLESFAAIQNFLRTGEPPIEFHGWAISADIGLYMLQKIRDTHYDLIIEFGSGSSTVLIAKGLQAMNLHSRVSSGTAEGLRSTTEFVSFDHDVLYHSRTQQNLQSQALDSMVQLVRAPLIDWQEDGETYLFYDCQPVLDALSKKHAGRQLNVLVLADGPPGTTCTNARYPVVPLIFQALGRHQIDLVLDDADRPEEKAVIEKWRNFWTKRAFRMSESHIRSEKGIYMASMLSV